MLDPDEAVLLQHLCVLSIQESACDSAGPEVDVPPSLFRYRTLDGHIGDMDASSRDEHALDMVGGLFEQAGLSVLDTETRLGTVRFGSIDEFIMTEIEGTPLIDVIDDDAYTRILESCRDAFGEFRTTDGSTEIPIEGHLITARKQ